MLHRLSAYQLSPLSQSSRVFGCSKMGPLEALEALEDLSQ